MSGARCIAAGVPMLLALVAYCAIPGTAEASPTAAPTRAATASPAPAAGATALPVPTPLPSPSGGVAGVTSPPAPHTGALADAVRDLILGLCLVMSGGIVLQGISQERRRVALLAGLR